MLRYSDVAIPKQLSQNFLFLLFLLSALYCTKFPYNFEDYSNANFLLFQTPLPEPDKPTKPEEWIFSGEGGETAFGAVTAIVPPGFTDQGGANVFVNVMIVPSQIKKPERLIPGTEFAFGIWPANDQVDYQKPIEFRITLDQAQITPGAEEQLVFMIYNPEIDEWQELPSSFQTETYQIVSYVQSFKPVARDFPVWGGRTFFGIELLQNKAEMF